MFRLFESRDMAIIMVLRFKGGFMRKFSRFQRWLVAFNVILLIIAGSMTALRQNTISNMGYSVWTYIKYGLFVDPLSSFGHMFQDVANLWHVYEDNVYLNQQLADQRSYQTLYESEKNRVDELKELMDMSADLDSTFRISAEVLSRPVEAWNQSCTISAGSNQGVQENMLVLSSKGAVGLVESVQPDTSVVRLITSNDLPNDIAVQIALEDGSTVQGVLQAYEASSNRYEVVLFNYENTITAGQLVSTSGKGGNYPSGIYVGTVTGVQMGDDSIISTIYVRPPDNITGFDYVEVVGNGLDAS